MFGREGCDPTAFFHYLRQPPARGLSLWQHSTKAKERHPELHASHSNLRRDTRSTADELAPGRHRRHNHVSFEKAWHGQGIFSLPTQLKRIWNHPLSLEITWAGRTAAAKEFPTCRDLYIISPRHCACLSRRKSQNLRKVTVHSASLCVFRAGLFTSFCESHWSLGGYRSWPPYCHPGVSHVPKTAMLSHCFHDFSSPQNASLAKRCMPQGFQCGVSRIQTTPTYFQNWLLVPKRAKAKKKESCWDGYVKST